MSCKKRKRLCAGDLDKPIIIYERSTLPPNYNEQQYRRVLENGLTVLAKITTQDGREIFDSSNMLEGVISHVIEIYPVGFNIDKNNHRIVYRDDEFKILKFENKDEDDLKIRMNCTNIGPVTLTND